MNILPISLTTKRKKFLILLTVASLLLAYGVIYLKNSDINNKTTDTIAIPTPTVNTILTITPDITIFPTGIVAPTTPMIVSPTSQVPPSVVSSNVLLYKNEKFGFTFNYPKDWSLKEDTVGSECYDLTQPYNVRKNSKCYTITITTREYNTKRYNLIITYAAKSENGVLMAVPKDKDSVYKEVETTMITLLDRSIKQSIMSIDGTVYGVEFNDDEPVWGNTIGFLVSYGSSIQDSNYTDKAGLLEIKNILGSLRDSNK